MTEERRLVAEEGSFSKKTWLPKIHLVLVSSIWAQYTSYDRIFSLPM